MSELEHGLETADYGNQGWLAIYNTDMEKLDEDLGGILEAEKNTGADEIADNATTQDDPAATTAVELTDSSGGSASQTIKAISGSGADTDLNDNFASLVDEINKVRADNVELRGKLIGAIDYCDALKTTVNTLLAALRETGGCGILADNS